MTEKKYDVVALGELLIDFTENGVSEQGNPLLEANPGGAPCNVLSMLTRLGKKTAFIGKVGNDGFGQLLTKAVQEQGIDTTGLRYDDEIHTTLALVLKKENGDRDFAFYRNPGADMTLREDEIDTSLVSETKVFHFGTLSLTDEPVIAATKKAVSIAKENGVIITFDPNLREPLWKSLDEAHEMISWGLQQADVVKISDNEITWFTGIENYDAAIEKLQSDYPNLKLICLSMGAEGSKAVTKEHHVFYPAFLQEKTIETTGAGDTFCACMINTVLENGIDSFNEETLTEMLKLGNAAASLVTTKKGALRVMPSKEEVLSFIEEFQK